VTVRSGGAPVEGARILKDGALLGTTDAGGKLAFRGCGIGMQLKADKDGYDSSTIAFQSIPCSECEEPPPAEPEQPSYECISDAGCPDTHYCLILPNQTGGSCQPVAGQCGEAKNHTFAPYGYECGSEQGCPQCPEGARCEDHECVRNDLACPSTAIVGDNKSCTATENTGACTNCDYRITAPDGRNFTGRTDELGNFDLPLSMEGTYRVSLIKDGQVVKVIEVRAFPQSAPVEPEKPVETPKSDYPWLLWLLILSLIVLIAAVYWRRRKKAQNVAKESEKKAKKA
jgi:hypothetical protein